MKDIVISNEVKQRIEQLMKQLHTLCVDNNVPMVASVILERTETNEGININKAVSTFIDSRTGAFDSTLVAAVEIIQLDRVPLSAINAISSLREDIKQRNKTQSKNFH
ncbi:hypothetical protein I5384_03155 [Citrobacter koseri]|uniref:hypothetical protein n=1 Tax=Citrobacter koseri TaxID=545 RepID=UPI001901A980|nr:hypothetical protein [Citrobacter koseri]MBJ8762880.1 hypothetical protein [Citrobacter koseri]MBJ9102008.1 hypothetical protein [Citrobacter koseri]HEM6680852.1 hypothetical protein [Citrobacter koseri]HEM6809069.1 hypothetical protein [Citrobacter koseri]